MHIPDGFIDAKTAGLTAVSAAAGLGYALRHVRRTLPPERFPMLGLAAAFIFAAQMLNFPVLAGTSGHLVGATLAAVLLGPGAAVIVMSSVVILQCLMFNDGGLTALGANLFNMAVLAPLVGFAVYTAIRRVAAGLRGRLLGAAFGAWVSTVAASLTCAIQLAASGTAPLRLVVPAMAGIHMLIGLGEAAITALVVAAVARARPDLLENRPATDGGGRAALVYGLIVSLGLAVFIAPFASSWPDGLEKVAESLGFGTRAASPALGAPLPDYTVPGIASETMSTVLAGVAGTLVAFLVSFLIARILTRRTAARPTG